MNDKISNRIPGHLEEAPLNRDVRIKDSGFARIRNDARKSDRALERFDEIGLLPGEAALIVGRAAEMAVGRGARVDRAVEIEMGADAARGQVHRLGDGLLELILRHLTGAVGVDVGRRRTRDADGVGELQRAAIGKPGGVDVLGDVARSVSGRTVNLGRILAGERTAAMRGRTTVGVDEIGRAQDNLLSHSLQEPAVTIDDSRLQSGQYRPHPDNCPSALRLIQARSYQDFPTDAPRPAGCRSTRSRKLS